MSIIKDFVALNRKCSRSLEEKFPQSFGPDLPSYRDELLSRISAGIKRGAVTRVLEIGGIDRPLLRKGSGFIYDGMDIETKDTCFNIYDKFIVQPVEKMQLTDTYDSIISITLLEHVTDNRSGIDRIFLSLTPGGEMHHYVPSKWHPYAVALRLVGPILQKKLIPVLRPGAESVSGYPAYFDHCTIPAMRRLLTERGFTDIRIKAFFRANDYFAFFTPLFILVTFFENICRRLDLNIFASGFVFSARKRINA
ncbi:MAG: hypothetical protein EPN25_06580 [Nitrospirae bacterium]|nr:MAG: hypothetical protein EPN25_06580 [Nitrospirota bacterium]